MNLQVVGVALVAAGVAALFLAWPWVLVVVGAVLLVVPELVERRAR